MDPRIVKLILDPKATTSILRGQPRKNNGELYYLCRRKQNKAEHLAKVLGTIGLAWRVTYASGLLSVHSANIKEKLEYSPIEVTEPLELVGMDLVGTLTTNGLVEKLNGTIQRSLNKMVAGHPKRWDQKQLTTKCSPYTLMFGREARYPSEVPEEYLVKEEKVSRLVEREEIHEGLKKPEAVFTEVQINMKTSQDKVRKSKVKKGQKDNFQVGDQVLRRNVRQEQRKGGSWRMTAHEDTDAPPSMDCDAHMAPKDPERWRRTQTLWCKFGPYEVYSENIMDLAPGKWLEGEIVNSYLTMVGRKAGALLIDSYLMTSLSGRETTKLDLLKHDVAVGAVCHHGH
ncbi:hypothetical protein KUCAC02_033339 [Chaenocephalus aceratus]|nr:hypothetical protein KUCAC02_033339 [Chaenocephalus aceratus]